jgi:2-oxo-3-hexenedioate decarboxylase/2-keto-4-pentenoate hydratase
VAVRLGRDLPASGAPYDRAAVAGAVEACAPAFELIEDRAVDYAGVDILACVAENSWNAGIVLGAEVEDWSALDLAAARSALTINDAAMGEGRGGDVMGHPLEPLAWLANALSQRGLGLERGMVVMTGSIITTKFLNPGDRARMTVDGLGAAELSVE